ncbi:MAG: hypothetical protein PHD97_08415 [Bacteroidales bacterium]|nr:hypothetical protein [Bacteroidales bacterium]
MRNLKYIFIFLSIIAFSFRLQSQTIKKFTEDPQKFIIELREFMEKEDKQLTKELMEKFEPIWISSKFSPERKNKVYSVANYMLRKKMKAFPHFNNFLTALMNFVNSDHGESSFNAWVSSLEKLMQRSTSTKFLFYIQMTNTLLTENAIYKSNFTKWVVSKSNYTFEFDTIPKLVFPSMIDLKCVSKDDSTAIYNTTGIYYPTENLWKGKGGKIYWDRSGFSKDSVYAELKNYKIGMQSIKYDADSVNFYMKMFFNQPLFGQVTDKVQFDVTSDKSYYPSFTSYNKRLQIPGIFPGIDYDGGFSLHGAKIMGAGTKEQKATLTFYKNNEKFIVTRSLSYMITKNMISGEKVSVTIRLEQDSLFHPAIQLKYMKDKNELSLMRLGEGIVQTPFYDSYHKLDMNVEAVTWKMNEQKINLTMVQTVGSDRDATFQSEDYYTERIYVKNQGAADTHPFQLIKNYAEIIKLKEIPVAKLANYMTLQNEDVRAMIINMACQGFLEYDPLTDKFIIKKKLSHYLKSHLGKEDYDIIQFQSIVTRGENASIDLTNFDLKVNGIYSILLSDSHNVVIKPYEQKITIKKNRDFDFMGRIQAGLFEFYGKDFNFLYDDFKINLNNVDSFSFKVPTGEKNENGQPKYERVRTMVENVNGELLLDDPKNKSGFKALKKYPIFNSKKDSYAYYDKKTIFGGVYNRENFFFQLEPFSFDSLDIFRTEGVKFGGTFASAGIFPDFDDSLIVRSDYSLGFARVTPKEGFPVYEGKGNYFNKIDLSNKGLHGDGVLKYITSTSKSNDFIFFPDSANALLDSFDVKEQLGKVEFPQVKGEDVLMHWMPYEDIMQIYKKRKPLEFYAGQAKMHGRIDLTPLGLSGDGTMEFSNAEIKSRNFKYQQITFDADSSDFQMKSYGQNDLSFVTINYKAHIDLKERKGEFESNSETASKVEFPVNQYISFMDEFTWYMEKEEIELTSKEKQTSAVKDTSKTPNEYADINLSGSRFISVHPAQDSLSFYSPKAKYNLRENTIFAQDVKFIKVADAAIVPDSGKVTILKRAEMKTLVKAKIVANTTTQYHNFYDASVNVLARNNYTAQANYDYIDETNKKQVLYFDKITVDSTYQTYGIGDISDKAQFTLSPYFDYFGSVRLTANNQYLKFTGNCMIKHSCNLLAKSWLHFSADINPNEIYIPIPEQPYNDKVEKIYTGFLHATDSAIYSAFISKKIRESDEELILSKGYLYFDKNLKEYHIAEMERIKENKLTGNFLSLNSYCDVYTEGKINFSLSLGQVSMLAYGNGINKTKSNAVKFDLVTSIDFFFSERCTKIMEDAFSSDPNAQPININRETYNKALVNILGQTEADRLISEISLYGNFKKLPSELEHTFFLPDVKLKWNPLTSSYVSEGKIGIGNINRTQINKLFVGYIELYKRRTGDQLTIYLEDGNKNWFYFDYKRGTMQVVSSSLEFNNIIKEMKPDDRQKKAEKGEKEPYAYMLTTEERKKKFLKKIGIEK